MLQIHDKKLKGVNDVLKITVERTIACAPLKLAELGEGPCRKSCISASQESFYYSSNTIEASLDSSTFKA